MFYIILKELGQPTPVKYIIYISRSSYAKFPQDGVKYYNIVYFIKVYLYVCQLNKKKLYDTFTRIAPVSDQITSQGKFILSLHLLIGENHPVLGWEEIIAKLNIHELSTL